MARSTFVYVTYIRTPPEKLWSALTDPEFMKQYWLADPHLYFQAPGGQCLRLVGIDEDLSFYEGAGEGPNVAKLKEALRRMSR
jgi:uncharacterized protein YndB with AHSA1/START domain